MPSNIEIKAKVSDIALVREIVSGMADHHEVIRQHDTFFPTRQGRLKLRELGPQQGELIHYDRPDTPSPKESRYRIVKTDNPRGLAAMLEAALGSVGIVCKVRHLYLVGQTRVHLDEVDQLGHFVELEVVLQPGQTIEAGIKIAEDLMNRLGICQEDLIEKPYVDLLIEKALDE